jgi:hypothetical protein
MAETQGLSKGSFVYLTCIPGVAWKVGYTSNLEKRITELNGVWTLFLLFDQIESAWTCESWLLWKLGEMGLRKRVPGVGQECLKPGGEIEAARFLFALQFKHNAQAYFMAPADSAERLTTPDIFSILLIEKVAEIIEGMVGGLMIEGMDDA